MNLWRWHINFIFVCNADVSQINYSKSEVIHEGREGPGSSKGSFINDVTNSLWCHLLLVHSLCFKALIVNTKPLTPYSINELSLKTGSKTYIYVTLPLLVLATSRVIWYSPWLVYHVREQHELSQWTVKLYIAICP